MLDPHQALQGKTELFQKKMTKKGPKTGSGGIVHCLVILKFFRDFPGSLKIQVEKSRVGKGGEAGAYALRKNHSNLLRTCKQTLAVGNPGSLKKRRLRRKNSSSSLSVLFRIKKTYCQILENKERSYFGFQIPKNHAPRA